MVPKTIENMTSQMWTKYQGKKREKEVGQDHVDNHAKPCHGIPDVCSLRTRAALAPHLSKGVREWVSRMLHLDSDVIFDAGDSQGPYVLSQRVEKQKDMEDELSILLSDTDINASKSIPSAPLVDGSWLEDLANNYEEVQILDNIVAEDECESYIQHIRRQFEGILEVASVEEVGIKFAKVLEARRNNVELSSIDEFVKAQDGYGDSLRRAKDFVETMGKSKHSSVTLESEKFFTVPFGRSKRHTFEDEFQSIKERGHH
eukprot:Gb_07860 [translate_table: standard]